MRMFVPLCFCILKMTLEQFEVRILYILFWEGSNTIYCTAMLMLDVVARVFIYC